MEEEQINADTISPLLPLLIPGKIYIKSLPSTIVFLPKTFLDAEISWTHMMSLKVRSTASNAYQCVIGASSHIIKLAFCTSFTNRVE